jgi:hypothetical protein
MFYRYSGILFAGVVNIFLLLTVKSAPVGVSAVLPDYPAVYRMSRRQAQME